MVRIQVDFGLANGVRRTNTPLVLRAERIGHWPPLSNKRRVDLLALGLIALILGLGWELLLWDSTTTSLRSGNRWRAILL